MPPREGFSFRPTHWPWFRRLKRRLRHPFRARRLARDPRREVTEAELERVKVGIILPTWNRLRYLRLGIPSLLAATRDIPCELLVWDNASTDGTAEFLDGLDDPRLSVVHHPENIGINALAASARRVGGTHLLQVDDDVIDFPPGFLRELVVAYESLPKLGYLGTNVVQDTLTDGGRLPAYRSIHVDHGDGLVVEYGAVGGWCTLTDRALYDELGGFLEIPGERYFFADRDYYRKVGARGLRRGILHDTRVYHACRVALDEDDRERFHERVELAGPAPRVQDDALGRLEAMLEAARRRRERRGPGESESEGEDES